MPLYNGIKKTTMVYKKEKWFINKKISIYITLLFVKCCDINPSPTLEEEAKIAYYINVHLLDPISMMPFGKEPKNKSMRLWLKADNIILMWSRSGVRPDMVGDRGPT